MYKLILAIVQTLAKTRYMFFRPKERKPDQVLAAGVTQPRLKRPEVGQPETIDRKEETGFSKQRINNQIQNNKTSSSSGRCTRGVLDGTSTMRGLEEMRRVVRVYRGGTSGTHTYSLQTPGEVRHEVNTRWR